MQTSQNRSQKGYSLLELMIVISLLALSLTIIGLPINNKLAREKDENEIIKLHAKIAKAQIKSQIERQDLIIIFSNSLDEYIDINEISENSEATDFIQYEDNIPVIRYLTENISEIRLKINRFGSCFETSFDLNNKKYIIDEECKINRI